MRNISCTPGAETNLEPVCEDVPGVGSQCDLKFLGVQISSQKGPSEDCKGPGFTFFHVIFKPSFQCLFYAFVFGEQQAEHPAAR